MALEFILATSAVYEIAEWLVAVTLAPDWADHYNGQQGDVWDAQKDMALAALGAAVGLLVTKLGNCLSPTKKVKMQNAKSKSKNDG